MSSRWFRVVTHTGWAALLCALLLAPAGCVGGDDESDGGSSDVDSPDHIVKAPKSQGKYRFGITDTIAIDFSEDIDTAALGFDFTDSAGIGWSFQGRRKVNLFGTRRNYETSHFPINSPFTLTLTGLRDLAGNGNPSLDIPFEPYAWVDRDFLDSTFDWYDTLYSGADTWLDGTPVTETFLTEGALDYAENFGDVDRYDFKVLSMPAPDTLVVSLSARRGLNVRMYVAGPFKPATFDSLLDAYRFETAPTTGEGTKVLLKDSTWAIGTVTRRFDASLFDHKAVLDDYDAPGLYVIRLGLPEGQEGFYRLSVQVKRRN